MTRASREPQRWRLLNALMPQACLGVEEGMGTYDPSAVLWEAGLAPYLTIPSGFYTAPQAAGPEGRMPG